MQPEPEPEVEDEPMDEEELAAKERKAQAQKEKEAGNAAYKARQFEAAVAHYDKAIELDDTDISFLTNRCVHMPAATWRDVHSFLIQKFNFERLADQEYEVRLCRTVLWCAPCTSVAKLVWQAEKGCLLNWAEVPLHTAHELLERSSSWVTPVCSSTPDEYFSGISWAAAIFFACDPTAATQRRRSGSHKEISVCYIAAALF